MKSIFKLFILVSFIQSFPYLSFGQISLSVRYGKGFVNTEILPSDGSFRENAIARKDLAFGLQIPIVKKWKLFIQAEIETHTKEYQKQFVTQNKIQLPDGGVRYEPVYEDIFYKVSYRSRQFPIILKKEVVIIPNLNLSILAGLQIGYTFTGVNSDILYKDGKETTSYIRTANNYELVYENIKGSADIDLKVYEKYYSNTPLVGGLGVSYQLSQFKLGAEYRYTTHNLLIRYSQPYHSANFILAYNLFNKNENKK